MELQDLPKEKLIEIIISTNKKRDRLDKKWHKVAMYWKGAFVNACQNQMRDNEVYRKRISELEKELGRQ